MGLYKPKFGKLILDGIKERGWKLYSYCDGDGDDDVIRRGPIAKIVLEIPYILFPIADRPKDPEEVKSRFLRFRERTGKTIPTIEIEDKDYDMGSVLFLPRSVELAEPEFHIAYRDFIESLYTLTPAFD